MWSVCVRIELETRVERGEEAHVLAVSTLTLYGRYKMAGAAAVAMRFHAAEAAAKTAQYERGEGSLVLLLGRSLFKSFG